ncbi:MAG: hypothetical protein MUC55_07415 [Burkholderiales bacterium]|jgi:hypothetical protein|nr:hypothetical protein [Burkholderiales bacterium]
MTQRHSIDPRTALRFARAQVPTLGNGAQIVCADGMKPQAWIRAVIAAERRGAFLHHVVGGAQAKRSARTLYAMPNGGDGSLAVVLSDIDERRRDIASTTVALVGTHAVARMLERRRAVSVADVLAEELPGPVLVAMAAACLDPQGVSDLRLGTRTGQFRGDRLGRAGAPVMLRTWLPDRLLPEGEHVPMGHALAR